VGIHPAACDWLSYLRYRDSEGPAASADADRILVAQPGILDYRSPRWVHRVNHPSLWVS
jgi:hypothetical protein